MTETAGRNRDLRQILSQRRREMQNAVHGRMREGRVDRPGDSADVVEQSGVDMQGDLDLALLQMRSETVARLDEALIRLDAGKYGSCFECEGEISDRRLRALPFAVRCQPCQEKREQEQARARLRDERRGGPAFFYPPM